MSQIEEPRYCLFEHKYENKEWVGYTKFIPEVLAVRIGVKPVMRIPINPNFGYPKFKELCKRFGLVTGLSDYQIREPYTPKDILPSKTPYGHYFMYVSRTQDLIELAKKYDLYDQDRFGELMGYPRCCIDYYSRVSNSPPVHEVYGYVHSKRPLFWQNNYLLRFNSNYYLHAYFLCSFDCMDSRKRGQKIFEAIRKFDEVYARKIEHHLKLPILLDDTRPGGILHNWDRLKGVVFNGSWHNNIIVYSGQLSLWQGAYFPIFSKSNQVLINADSMYLYSDGRLIGKIKITNNFESFFLQFS
ncbi:MAG: DUF483 domain-containing protein [Candidatus Woesearchaeota archaeon]